METVLVTGGAGFIGSHLVAAAVRRGLRVRVLDNVGAGGLASLAEALGIAPPARDGPGRRAALSDVCEFVRGDVRDPAACAEACDGVSVVFHLAAQRSIPRSIADPIGALEHNAIGTMTLLLAARDAGVRRVIYASSSSVYGESPQLPSMETQRPMPISPYGLSKLAGEHACAVCSRLYGISTISLRYFNVFGPRHDPSSPYAAVVPRFIAALGAGDPVVVYGDGQQSRDFTYVDNVVAANFLAMEAARGAGDTYNISGGRAVTVLALIEALGRVIDRTPRVVHAAPRPGDIRHSLADLTAARLELGYRPLVDFEEGLRRTVRAFAALAQTSDPA
ncbi:MAG TPA: NAD-dependent epimerase/dehydratase family protein [bacterium]|nr:NAD-dependent epimerase/dehydratase family protein [bacterium]